MVADLGTGLRAGKPSYGPASLAMAICSTSCISARDWPTTSFVAVLPESPHISAQQGADDFAHTSMDKASH
jgi:hypothetical protein